MLHDGTASDLREDIKDEDDSRASTGSEDLLALIAALLTERKPPAEAQIDPVLFADPAFRKVFDIIGDLRSLTSSLGRGELQQFVYGRGYILSGLKALQANLRHLTWQTQRIAQGDFSQKVDFLGDFSLSFNAMVEQLAGMTDQMRRLASMDALTKIHNRLSLEQFFEVAFDRAKAEGTPLSTLMFDIDLFKQVNDSYGHPVGDEVLIQVSDTLNRQFRCTDMFARFGGEEFIAVLPGTDLETAGQIALRGLSAVEDLCIPIADGIRITVSVSAGASQMLEGDESYQQIVERADKALYEAKHSGRNRVCSC